MYQENNEHFVFCEKVARYLHHCKPVVNIGIFFHI